jgi:hypothetical protein
MPDPLNTRTAEIEARARKALRTPDLEWAHDLVHGLANDSLELLAALRTAREALREIDQYRAYGGVHDAYREVKRIARAALAPEQTDGTA